MEQLWAPWRFGYIMSIRTDGTDDCVFCLAPGASPETEDLVVFRGAHAFVVLNKFPYNNGHLLVVPYAHCPDLGALEADARFEIMHLTAIATQALARGMNAQGFNIGMNLGRAAGAGIDAHLHMHVVPRWSGDTNFMPVLGDTKVISQGLAESLAILREQFRELLPSPRRP